MSEKKIGLTHETSDAHPSEETPECNSTCHRAIEPLATLDDFAPLTTFDYNLLTQVKC